MLLQRKKISVLVSDPTGEVTLQPMRWWLTPSWAKQPSTRYSMFNAKAETAANLPSFREPYKKRRCVVPVSGFYEWARRQGHKQAYLLQSAETQACCWPVCGIAGRARDENGQSPANRQFHHFDHGGKRRDAAGASPPAGYLG